MLSGRDVAVATGKEALQLAPLSRQDFIEERYGAQVVRPCDVMKAYVVTACLLAPGHNAW